MTVSTFAQRMDCSVLCASPAALERKITGGYCGDLLSWVMSRAQAGDAWFTVMGNVNAVGVAALADVACIVLTENAALDATALERAEQNEVVILRSPANAYTLSAALARLLAE